MESASYISIIFQQHGLNVSRETFAKLETYDALLKKWQKTINLVSNSTLNDTSTRHFLDSAQLLPHIPDSSAILADLGSGAGFPGMVLAILGLKNVHLIESDSRKTAFLHNVSRETMTPVTIHNKRVEDCKITPTLVTARALAPLGVLLDMTAGLGTKEAIFLKGAQAEEEIKAAGQVFSFSSEILPSLSDPSGKIIKISNLAPKT